MRLAGPAQWYEYPEAPSVGGPVSIPVTFTPGRRSTAPE
jgi:hypothetical protein